MFVYLRPAERYLTCLVCGGVDFGRREIKMNTTGMSFMGMDWANKAADGVICTRCGFVHTFFGVNGHIWVDPNSVPQDTWPVPGIVR